MNKIYQRTVRFLLFERKIDKILVYPYEKLG